VTQGHKKGKGERGELEKKLSPSLDGDWASSTEDPPKDEHGESERDWEKRCRAEGGAGLILFTTLRVKRNGTKDWANGIHAWCPTEQNTGKKSGEWGGMRTER